MSKHFSFLNKHIPRKKRGGTIEKTRTMHGKFRNYARIGGLYKIYVVMYSKLAEVQAKK